MLSLGVYRLKKKQAYQKCKTLPSPYIAYVSSEKSSSLAGFDGGGGIGGGGGGAAPGYHSSL